MNLREDESVDAVNGWIGDVFAPRNVDETVAAILMSQGGAVVDTRDGVKQRLADAETRLQRHRAAIEAGVNPAALVEAMNEAQAERAAAKAELANAPAVATVTDAEVYAMIDSLGDVGRVLTERKPEELQELYEKLGLELRYDATEKAAYVAAYPRVVAESIDLVVGWTIRPPDGDHHDARFCVSMQRGRQLATDPRVPA